MKKEWGFLDKPSEQSSSGWRMELALPCDGVLGNRPQRGGHEKKPR